MRDGVTLPRSSVGPPRALVWCLRFTQMVPVVVAIGLAWLRLNPYEFKVGRIQPQEIEEKSRRERPVLLRQNWKTSVKLVRLDGRICVEKKYLGGLNERAKSFVEVGHLWSLRRTGVTPKILGFDPFCLSIYLEYIEGSTLKEFIQRSAKRSEGVELEEVRARAVAQFSKLHRQGLFVNDVTARNILIEENGSVRVIDLADSVSVRFLPGVLRQRCFVRDLARLRHHFQTGTILK